MEKKAQQTKPEAFADLTTTAVWAPAGWLEAVREEAGWKHAQGWVELGEWAPARLALLLLPMTSVPERASHFYHLSQCFMISTRDAGINKHRTKYGSQVDGLDHTDRLRLCHTAVKYKLKTKKHLFSHPAESPNGFQQWVGHKAVFLKWKCCSYFLRLISKAGNNAERTSSIKKLKSILQHMILVKPWFG